MTLATAGFLGLWSFASVALLSIAAQNILFVGMAAWVLRCLGQRRFPGLPQPMGLLVFFLAIALTASFASPNVPHSLFTWKKWLLAGAAIYAVDALRTRRALQAVLGSLLFFSALWCLGASLVYLAKPLSFWMQGHAWDEVAARWVNDIDWRAGSGSGGYQVLATCAMLLLLTFSALVLSDVAWRRPLVYGCLASIALALLLTLTRGAWIAALLGMGFLFARKKPGLLVLGLLLLALTAGLLQGSPFVKRLKSVGDRDNDSNRERIYMAEAGISMIREHPWLGVGDSLSSFERDGVVQPGNFLTHRSAEAIAWYRSKGVGEKEQGHLHDDLLQVAAMYGVPALLVLLLFFGKLWAMAARTGPASLWGGGLSLGFSAALLGWWVNGIFEYNFGSFQSSFVLWFLCGLFLASRNLEAPS